MEQVLEKSQHGALYWMRQNTLIWLRSCWGREKSKKSKVTTFTVLAIFFFLMLLFRALWQPWVVALRIYSFEWFFGIIGLYLLVRYRRSIRWYAWITLVVLVAVGGAVHHYLHFEPHRYITSYLQYESLNISELDELPETDYERIQPLNSIRVIATESMDDVNQVSDPFFVRIDNEYRFTMAKQPSYTIRRIFGTASEIISVSGTSPSPDFSSENRHEVSFLTADKLLLGANSHVATIRSFGLGRFLSYQPSDVKYVKDDSGEWVQLVSLIRWKGFFFPRPEFGGVQVIRQEEGGFLHFLKVMFLGDGEWIRPQEVEHHPYLRGQNIVPYQVGRYVAESFRFQNGFFAPFSGIHSGDVRIPDLPGDANDQPFISFFRFKDGEGESKLYQYFALEPYEETRQGLNTSVLFPADGIGSIPVCRHADHGESLIGVSAVAAKVMESKKQYDWNRSRPAENRPYIKIIDGKKRFMWLTTTVTYKSLDTDEFIAGDLPEVSLIDAKRRQVAWMNPGQPVDEWQTELKKQLRGIWKSE